MTAIFIGSSIYAQDAVTNAFDDLNRKGIVKEEFSVMRQIINGNDLQRLLDENPKSGFFCFTEDRMHDIRLTDNIPQRWANRTTKERKSFSGESLPGEYYTFQVGVYSPYRKLNGVEIRFTDLVGEKVM